MQKLKLILFFFFAAKIAFAQTEKKEFSRFALKAGLGSQAVGFPFENITSSAHPAILAGAEYMLNRSLKHTLAVSATGFLYFNKTIGNSFSTSLDFLYRYTHRSGMFTDMSVAVGSIYQLHPRTIYEFDQTTMEYHKTTDEGKFSSQVGFGWGIGYDFNNKYNMPVKVFVRNNFLLQTPYFDSKQFPIMPQNILNVGVIYRLPEMKVSNQILNK